jgi:hypothetical protein
MGFNSAFKGLNTNANQHHLEQLIPHVYFLSSGSRIGHVIKRLEKGLNDPSKRTSMYEGSECLSLLQNIQTDPESKLPSYLLGFRIAHLL